MPSAVTATQLSEVPLLHNFESDEIAQLLEACELVDYTAGQTVVQEGDEQRALYVVVSGDVEVFLAVAGLQEAIVATLGPKSVFGEASFFHASPHTATARCRTAVSLARLNRAKYDELVAAGSRAAYRLSANAAEILASRLHATDQWLVRLLAENQTAMVASWQRFRERLGTSFEPVRGFMHPY